MVLISNLISNKTAWEQKTKGTRPSPQLFLFLIYILLNPIDLFSQTTEWTLDQCIDHAKKNNIQVKQARLQAEITQNQLTQNYGNALPSINANASHNYNFGRTIDPFTNQFVTERFQSNNFSLTGSLVVFNGFQNYNRILQSQLEFKASQADLEKMLNDISLNVATAFLQVLYNDELLLSAKEQEAITSIQVERTQKLVNAGALQLAMLKEIEAQLASEQLQVIISENNLNISYLNLTQLLEIENSKDFKISRPDITNAKNGSLPENYLQIYQLALENQPVIKSAEYRLKSADKNAAAFKGDFSPRLVLSGSIGTLYSELSGDLTGYTTSGFDTIGFTPSSEPVVAPRLIPVISKIPFNDQLNNNLNHSLGLYLTVPIFNGFQKRSQFAISKIQLENARHNLELQKKQLSKNINTAYTDALAGLKKLQAAEKNHLAQEDAFKFTEQKYNLGSINSFEFNQSKTRLALAKSNLLQAKYDLIFKLKILDFYQGKPLTL